MKNLFLLLLLIIVLGCKESNEFKIIGTFKGSPQEEWVYLVRFMDDNPQVDSAKIINGKFEFTGSVNTIEMYGISYHFSKAKEIAPIFLEPAELSIEIDLNNWYLNSTVKGGKVNEEYNTYKERVFSEFLHAQNSLFQKLDSNNEEDKKMINDQLNQIEKDWKEFELKYITQNPKSPVALFLFASSFMGMSEIDAKNYLSIFEPHFNNTAIFKTIYSFINPGNLTYNKLPKENIINELVELNKGKVLYIDVWATWCGPCNKEIPYSQKLLDSLRDKNVEFIYICINSKQNDWDKIVIEGNLKGQHYLLDNDQAKNLSNEVNGIKTIPRYIIVDKNGNIFNNNADRPSDKSIYSELVKLSI